MTYHALYRSSTKSCHAEILSVEHEQLNFAGTVNTFCESCKNDHGFNFVQAFTVTGPKILAQLLETAKSKHWNIEKGVTTSE